MTSRATATTTAPLDAADSGSLVMLTTAEPWVSLRGEAATILEKAAGVQAGSAAQEGGKGAHREVRSLKHALQVVQRNHINAQARGQSLIQPGQLKEVS